MVNTVNTLRRRNDHGTKAIMGVTTKPINVLGKDGQSYPRTSCIYTKIRFSHAFHMFALILALRGITNLMIHI